MEKVKVNKDACIGCGACQAIIPEVFELEDDGLAHVKESFSFEDVSEEVEADILDAMDGCPTAAIVDIDE